MHSSLMRSANWTKENSRNQISFSTKAQLSLHEMNADDDIHYSFSSWCSAFLGFTFFLYKVFSKFIKFEMTDRHDLKVFL